jgi:molybdate transport system substrate-binding protein
VRSRVATTALLVAAALGLAACGGSTSGAPTTSAPAGPTGTITVFAAASLTESFTEIGKQFEAANPGTKVVFSFGPSSGLATQITEKAPADVFASASTKTMQTVVDAGDAAGPSTFAVNTMIIATPAEPSEAVTSLQDLTNPDVKTAVCAADVPCGVAADALFEKNKLAVTPVTREVDVKAVLSKVQLGEVDAGIVYVTDVKGSDGAVNGIEIPADENVTTDYPIAALTGSANSVTAQAFVDFVLSAAGQKVLADAGFSAP